MAVLTACALHGGIWWSMAGRATMQPPRPLPMFQMVNVPEPEPEPEPASPDATPPVPEPEAAQPPPPPATVAETAPQPQVKPRTKPRARPAAPRQTRAPAGETPAAAAPAVPPPVEQPPISHAAYLQNPKPVYPLVARRRGWEGVVLLRVTVSASGEALEVAVKQGSGYPLLDQAATQTVQQWRFVPARRGETRVTAQVDIPIRFSLQDT